MSFIQIFFLIVMIIWFVGNTIYWIKDCKRRLIKANKDQTYSVRCEKCGNEHSVSYEEIISRLYTKYKSKTKGMNSTIVGLSVTTFSYYCKKVRCPNCKKITWHEVKDLNNKMIFNTKAILPSIILYFVFLLAGGNIIIIVSK